MNLHILKKISLWNRARLDKRRSRKIPYQRWVKLYDTLTPKAMAELKSLRAHASAQSISLITELRTPDPSHLLKAIESLVAQLHTNWELQVLIPDSSPSKARDRLLACAKQDSRIHVLESGDINSAITQATGPLLIFLDPDSLLRPHALLMLDKALELHPQGKIFYSDEDRLDGNGLRHDPAFKPGWNPHLFWARNYLGQLTACNLDLVKEVGGIRPDFGPSAIHDLLLRCTERIQETQVVHIPFILIHVRSSAPPSPHTDKTSAVDQERSRRAVAEHLHRINVQGDVVTMDGINHVRYAANEAPPMVSIIIPSRDRPALLKQCVRTVLESTRYPRFEVIFIDNGTSDPEALALIEQFRVNPRFKLLVDHSPFNYSKLNNQGVALAGGEVICLLNNDVEITDPHWLSKLVAVGSQKNVGVVGARLLFPSGQLQHAGVILGVGGVAGHAFSYKAGDAPTYMDRAKIMHELSAVTGACLLTTKALFEQVGGLDEALSVAFNDIDFCLKVRALKKKVIYAPQVELIHHESASRGKDDTHEKKARFGKEIRHMQQKWATWLEADPAYNPNLTLKTDGFSLADPPRVQAATYLTSGVETPAR